MVFALNRIPPRYVTTLQGQAVSGVALERDQERAAIDVAVVDGVRKVAASPRCGRKARKP